MIVSDVGGQELSEARSRGSGRARRVGIIVLGTILVVALCVVVAVGFVESSWWYFQMGDRPLTNDCRAHVKAVRDEVAADGAAPDAVAWLDAALGSNSDPTAVRAYLLSAQETLEAAGDPALTRAAEEIEAIILTLQAGGSSREDTPYPVPTLVWKESDSLE